MTSEFLEEVSVPNAECLSTSRVVVFGLLDKRSAIARPTAPAPIIWSLSERKFTRKGPACIVLRSQR